MKSLLTLDLGNTACKACLWTRPGSRGLATFDVEASAAWPNGGELADQLVAWLGRERARSLDRVALASVAARDVEASLLEELASLLDERLVVAPRAGVENATRTPETVGADRLYAARGAFELLGTAAIVVDAGTAVTVDALEVDAGSGAPRFLGGAIAPGPRLLAEALAHGTARLPLVQLRGAVDALGRDTAAAIASGVVHGLRGAVRELAARIAKEAGIEGAPLVVTGGARALLLQPPLDEASGVPSVEDEHLVHRGLCAALLDEPGATATARHRLA